MAGVQKLRRILKGRKKESPDYGMFLSLSKPVRGVKNIPKCPSFNQLAKGKGNRMMLCFPI